MEPEAFGYCWHRNNGEFYYGIHKGTLDDGYTGSGTKFKRKFNGSDRSEWRRTIEFRGNYDECLEWELDMVTKDMVEQPDCLNMQPGGRMNVLNVNKDYMQSEEYRKKMSIATSGERNGNFGFRGKKPAISAALKGYKYPTKTCPHCNRKGGGPNMIRYHFDNCKENRDA